MSERRKGSVNVGFDQAAWSRPFFAWTQCIGGNTHDMLSLKMLSFFNSSLTVRLRMCKFNLLIILSSQ